MLEVIKIIEGGINLKTKEQLPRSLVISNGVREVEIPLANDHLQRVIGLIADSGSPSVPMGQSTVSQPSRPIHRRPPASPQPVFVQPDSPAPRMTPGPLVDDVINEEGFEPGEDFKDRGTGVGSL